MADRFFLSESDRQVLVRLLKAESNTRRNSLKFEPEYSQMAPEVYIVKGAVPGRDLKSLIPGSATLPIFKLAKSGSSESGDDFRIVPLEFSEGIQKELKVFNVRCVATEDDFNYIKRDKAGRWHIDFHPECPSVSSVSSSISSSSVSSSSVPSVSSISSVSSSVSLSSSVSISVVSVSVSVVECVTIPGVDFESLPVVSASSVDGVLAVQGGCLVLVPITECP